MFRSESAWNSREIPDRVKERAATKWVESGDCWISAYSTGSHGYAQVGWQDAGQTAAVLAHRASWEHHHGPVPTGHTLDHLCKQRRCVNPEHLRILPNFDNARRTFGRDWPLGQCANGHSDSFIKLYSRGAGKPRRRRCSICYAEVQRRYNQKRQAA